jgi:tetrahydromethanopterin S-methyltransferase subunit D
MDGKNIVYDRMRLLRNEVEMWQTVILELSQLYGVLIYLMGKGHISLEKIRVDDLVKASEHKYIQFTPSEDNGILTVELKTDDK